MVTAGETVMSLGIERNDNDVTMICGQGAVRFSKNISDDQTSVYRPSVLVQASVGDWEEIFDGQIPLIRGAQFDLEPTAYTVTADEPAHKALLFTGYNKKENYDWQLLVEATDERPMIHFELTCHLTSSLELEVLQPDIALWRSGGPPELFIEQGPMSIYGSYGYCFPAAYLWDKGNEAVLYFDMTPMTWMSKENVWRFHNCRVKAIDNDKSWGLGLSTTSLQGNKVPAGDMVVSFYVYAGRRKTCPSRLEGYQTMLEKAAPLFPSTAPWPKNLLEPQMDSWKEFAQKGIEDLLVIPDCYGEEEVNWKDTPLELVAPIKTIPIHFDRPMNTYWNFSTIYVHSSSWALFSQLNPEIAAQEAITRKKDAIAVFYDPKSKLIRRNVRLLEEKFPWGMSDDYTMSWEDFSYALEVARTYTVLSESDFNPSIAGRYLMTMESLIEYAHNVNYVFGQFFDPYKKIAANNTDYKDLADTREPWQVGLYAQLMLYAYDFTEESKYLNEAKTSIETLLTTMKYRMKCQRYDVTYNNPADFPITEICGNAYGVASAYRIYELTGDKRFMEYSRIFLNTLLRYVYWYEDNTAAIGPKTAIRGLFAAHGGNAFPCPWETADAVIALAYSLKHDRTNPLTSLMLKVLNLQRINSFYFYSPMYSDEILAISPALPKNPYIPVELMYTLETIDVAYTGLGKAAYMGSHSLWNYWLYEALGQADDREVLVVNLDVLENFQEAVQGIERHFIVFNPMPQDKSFRLKITGLPEATYNMVVEETNGSCTIAQSGKELSAGYAMNLSSMKHTRITISRQDADSEKAQLRRWRQARDALSQTYCRLQQDATTSGLTDELLNQKDDFLKTMDLYRQSKYQNIVDHLKSTK